MNFPPRIRSLALCLLLVCPLGLSGCESADLFYDKAIAAPGQAAQWVEQKAVNALDSVPVSAEQLDGAARASAFIERLAPAPGGYLFGGGAVILGLIADLKRRREKKGKIVTRAWFGEVVESVRTYLDGLPAEERVAAKAQLAAKQDAATQAAVAMVRAGVTPA